MNVTPYIRLMRLHQPVGIWLLLWPCWWALALASGGALDQFTMGLFALGALLMRSAGCVINDIADREFDKQVERTKDRPLASGELSVRQALQLLAILLKLSLLVAIFLGWQVVIWSVAALPLVALYPLMKRITWWPQLFLGLTFNWGALLGWVAVKGEVGMPALLLYAGGVCWTLGYDTIYAHQDTIDDARIGVKSSALRLGVRTKPFVMATYVVAMACWLAALSGAGKGLGVLYMLAALHFIWQVYVVDLHDPLSARRIFFSNAWLGAIIFLACLLGL